MDFLIPPQKYERLEGQASGEITVVRAPDSRAEGYQMEATPAGISITCSDDAGEFYARQTVRELEMLGMPACRIEDWPDFPRRAVYLDCARGKVPTVATLKALVERLARWKINELQLYIKNAFHWKKHPLIGQGFSRFTPADLLEVQAHCQKHHIKFVPSLASFSHMELVLMLPEYAHLAELPMGLGWPGGTTLSAEHPGSIELVQDLYEEFVPLFDAVDFNVCCDEPWELGQGRSLKSVGLQGKGKVYLDFLLKIHALCERHGKRMNLWGDVVLSHPELIKELPKDIVMLNWDYNPDGRSIPRTAEFSQAEIPVIVCPGTLGWNTHGTWIDKSMANVSRFAAEGRKCNAAGFMNTDWGDYGHRNFLGVSLHSYAHGAAHAWNGAAVDDAQFTRRFTLHAFGDTSGQLAKSIQELGSCGEDARRLYHALVEPLTLPATRFIWQFPTTSIVSHYPNTFPECISGLTRTIQPIHWPAAAQELDEFEQLALQEFDAASRMNVLASRRASMGQQLRSGQSVSTEEREQWAVDMEAMMADFERLWLARNRTSRLDDNKQMMQWAIDECRQ